MAIQLESPEGADDLREFVLFHDVVYAGERARWEAPVGLQLPVLLGETPFTQGRELRAFAAREGGELAARCVAIDDARYREHWDESLGHIVLFEALPEAREAAGRVIDAAALWLWERGLEAARTGFWIPLDMPLRCDAYDVLQPSMLRQTPPGYHALLEAAGFEPEQGFVDYKGAITPERAERWRDALESCTKAGFEIVPIRDLPHAQWLPDFTETFEQAFWSHWGFAPGTAAEWDVMFSGYEDVGVRDTSVIAYQNGEPVGCLMVAADAPEHAALAPGAVLADDEKLNMLAIGVLERARGRGVSYAMAAHALLELARRGRTHFSYTLVLDDNWASRRTGQGLGAEVCASLRAYRRLLRG